MLDSSCGLKLTTEFPNATTDGPGRRPKLDFEPEFCIFDVLGSSQRIAARRRVRSQEALFRSALSRIRSAAVRGERACAAKCDPPKADLQPLKKLECQKLDYAVEFPVETNPVS